MIDPIEAEIRNLVAIQRQGNTVARVGRKVFREQVLEGSAAAVARRDPVGVLPRYRPGRLEKLLQELAAVARSGYRDIYNALADELAAIGVTQARWIGGVLRNNVKGADATIGVPVTRGAARAALREGAIDGLTLREWLRRAESAYVEAAKREVRRVVAANGTSDEVRRAVTGRAARTARRHLDVLSRTATTYIANTAKEVVYQANSDVLSGIEFVATLDSRTTIICARWDGTVWPVDSPNIQRPPLHVGCRSALAPVVDWEGLGLETPKRGTRASEQGQTSAATYDRWFRGQSEAKQDSIVGPTRARLYRDGKITFRDMVTRDNRLVPVSELIQR